MKKKNEDGNAAKRQNKGEKDRQARHEWRIASANSVQHDETIDENSGKGPQRDLRDTAANKISQDA